MKQRTKTIWKTAAALCLLAGVLACGTLSAFTLGTVRELAEREDRREREKLQEEQPREDGVVIAERYEVKPTTAISDAYRSGDTTALTDKERETLDMAAAVLEEIIQGKMSDYEKERAVYDWMTSHLQSDGGLLTVIPSTQADCDNPYGVLKYHNAVCVGYATTFRLFMQMLGIDCMVVHNTEQFHTWDLVKLDGDWYHVDIYSDVGQGGYANFNLNDQIRGRENDWDRSFYPAATGLKYNEGYRGCQSAEDIYGIPARLRTALDEGKGVLYLKFDTEIDETQAQIAERMLQEISDRLCNAPAGQQAYLSWLWTREPETQRYLLVITMSREDSGEAALGDEAEEKIRNAVEEAFGDIEESGWSENDITGGEDGEVVYG